MEFMEIYKQTSFQRKVHRMSNQVSYQEKATISIALMIPSQKKDVYHFRRPDQVMMVILNTGHNRSNAHMHKKLKTVPSAACPCSEEDKTTEHILQNCKRHGQGRCAA